MPQPPEHPTTLEGQTRRQRLLDVAAKCILEHPESRDQWNRAVWEEVRTSALLLETLFGRWKTDALDDLVSEVLSEGKWGLEPVSKKIAKAQPIAGEWRRLQEERQREWDLEAQLKKEIEWERREAKRKEDDAERWKLFEFRINGVALADVTATQAHAWATRSQKETDFVQRAISGVSLFDPRKLGDILDPVEVEQCWRDAMQL